MKRIILVLVVLCTLAAETVMAAEAGWKAVTNVLVTNGNHFIIKIEDETKQFFIEPGVRGATENGVKHVLAVALSSLATGNKVYISYDENTYGEYYPIHYMDIKRN